MQRHERSFGGFRLSPTPPTRSDESSSCAKHALLAENARSTEFPTDLRLPHSGTPPTASRKSATTMQWTRLTRRRPRRIQSKQSPVKKGRFRLTKSDCIIIGVKHVFDTQIQSTKFSHKSLSLRPFLTLSDLSIENGRFRLKPKSGFLTRSKKSFFDSTFCD